MSLVRFLTFWLVQPEAEQVHTGFLRDFLPFPLPLAALSPSVNAARGATSAPPPKRRVTARRDRATASQRAKLSNRSPSMLRSAVTDAYSWRPYARVTRRLHRR